MCKQVVSASRKRREELAAGAYSAQLIARSQPHAGESASRYTKAPACWTWLGSSIVMLSGGWKWAGIGYAFCAYSQRPKYLSPLLNIISWLSTTFPAALSCYCNFIF